MAGGPQVPNDGGNGEPDAQLQQAQAEEGPHGQGVANDLFCCLGGFEDPLVGFAVEKLVDPHRNEGVPAGHQEE